MPTTSTLAEVKAEIKAWERQFRSEHGGSDPVKEDIKRNPEIAAKYSLYRRLSKSQSSASTSTSHSIRPVSSTASTNQGLTAATSTKSHSDATNPFLSSSSSSDRRPSTRASPVNLESKINQSQARPNIDVFRTPTKPKPSPSAMALMTPSAANPFLSPSSGLRHTSSRTKSSGKDTQRSSSSSASTGIPFLGSEVGPSTPSKRLFSTSSAFSNSSSRQRDRTPQKPFPTHSPYNRPIQDPTISSAANPFASPNSNFVFAPSPQRLRKILEANSPHKRKQDALDDGGYPSGSGSGSGIALGITPRTKARKRLRGEEVEDTPPNKRGTVDVLRSQERIPIPGGTRSRGGVMRKGSAGNGYAVDESASSTSARPSRPRRAESSISSGFPTSLLTDDDDEEEEEEKQDLLGDDGLGYNDHDTTDHHPLPPLSLGGVSSERSSSQPASRSIQDENALQDGDKEDEDEDDETLAATPMKVNPKSIAAGLLASVEKIKYKMQRSSKATSLLESDDEGEEDEQMLGLGPSGLSSSSGKTRWAARTEPTLTFGSGSPRQINQGGRRLFVGNADADTDADIQPGMEKNSDVEDGSGLGMVVEKGPSPETKATTSSRDLSGDNPVLVIDVFKQDGRDRVAIPVEEGEDGGCEIVPHDDAFRPLVPDHELVHEIEFSDSENEEAAADDVALESGGVNPGTSVNINKGFRRLRIESHRYARQVALSASQTSTSNLRLSSRRDSIPDSAAGTLNSDSHEGNQTQQNAANFNSVRPDDRFSLLTSPESSSSSSSKYTKRSLALSEALAKSIFDPSLASRLYQNKNKKVPPVYLPGEEGREGDDQEGEDGDGVEGDGNDDNDDDWDEAPDGWKVEGRMPEEEDW